jgi:hypothetical protein
MRRFAKSDVVNLGRALSAKGMQGLEELRSPVSGVFDLDQCPDCDCVVLIRSRAFARRGVPSTEGHSSWVALFFQ